MDNTLYVSLSRQMTLRREMDIIANNIANADTTGFKVENLMVRTEPARPARMADGPNPVKFVLDDGVARDFTQGSMRTTGATFDLAIEGKGFFKVDTAAGERFTRDGRFTLSPEGKITTQDGDAVQGESGDIVVDPAKGQVAIAKDGTVSQGINIIGKVEVSRFDDLSSLRKDGDNLFRNVSNQTAQPAPDARVHQGMLEGSNVKTIEQVTRLIEVNRAYDSISKMMADTSDLSRRSIERIGKLN